MDVLVYARSVARFLERLEPEVAVHRLGAVASRWEEMVAPDWVRHKMGPTQYILEHLDRMDTWQGRCRPPVSTAAAPDPAALHPFIA